MSRSGATLSRGSVLAVQKLVSGGGPMLAIAAAGAFADPFAVAALGFQLTLAQVVVVLADLGASRLLTREAVVSAVRDWSLPWLLLLRALTAGLLWLVVLAGPWAGGRYLEPGSATLWGAVAWSLLGTGSMAFYGLRLTPGSLQALAGPLFAGVAALAAGIVGFLLVGHAVAVALALALAAGRAVELLAFLATMRGEWAGGGLRGSVALTRRGLPLLGQQATSLLYGRITVLAAAGVLAAEAYALFNVARSIYGMASLVPASLAHSCFPSWIDAARRGTTALRLELAQYLRHALPVHAILLGLGAAGLVWLPLPGELYQEHGGALAAVLAANLFALGTAAIGFLYLSLHLERRLLALSMGNAVFGFALTIALCAWGGAAGALWSIALADIATLGLFGAGLATARPGAVAVGGAR